MKMKKQKKLTKTQIVKIFISLICLGIGIFILYGSILDRMWETIPLAFIDFLLAGFWVFNPLPLFSEEYDFEDNQLSILGLIKQ